MKLMDLYRDLKPDIKVIEKTLEEAVDSKHAVLTEASNHLLKAGGKRIRPVLVLLSAKFGNYDIEHIKHAAASLELIHMASLVHDDVIDDAELRRGESTVKAAWDNKVAMYTGDYIFGSAVERAAYYRDPVINRIISKTLIEICVGEIEQIRDQYNWEQPLRTYLRRIRRKTAVLIAAGCELGAASAGASKKTQRQLYRYGYHLGMSYQIIDDILDFTGSEKELGKPAGGDLRQGNVTLPALYAMHQNPQLQENISAAIQEEAVDEEQVTRILSEINNSGGIEYAKKMSERYLEKAYEAIAALPDIEAKDSLKDIAAYIGGRKY
ncbi:heptaprenyl diphosphate synthase component II [Marinococcus luteus]|uniref:heptaprenyl diphosphate synthase component II n=1 Tax=Marinococcus luteus TaxID=1122204 RepID=UPI002ACCF86B|nr:heptaprenyl diphosphate synthase component II [Marinococcus luteus]MDZ5782313.1 heptaprenyl diphosphate synthase component II [Marinococcus luteus]